MTGSSLQTLLFLILCLLIAIPGRDCWIPHRPTALLRNSRKSTYALNFATNQRLVNTPQPPPQQKPLDTTSSSDPDNITWGEEDDGIWGEDDAEDVDFLKYLQDEFDSISTNGKLTFDQFVEWEECQDILADEFLTLKDLLRIWNKIVGSNTKACDFETFLAVNEEIDASV